MEPRRKARMTAMNRRSFLGRAAAAAGALAAMSASSYARVLGANDAIRAGVAGLNGRGESHVGAFAKMKDVQVAFLIDPDRRTFAPRIKQVEERGGAKPETFQDIRKALERRDLDVVSVATTNHWHSLITIWACQAGKDVYVEKPLSHTVREGRVAVEAARTHKRIVQHGTQSRGSESWARAAALARSGKLGKLLVSRALCYKRRGSIGVKEPKAPPPEIDFNLWLGPAAARPYHENLVHYNWHWFWDFGNGDIGNQGVHQMDIARWCIPGATLPRSVVSLGGRFGYADQGETPNTQIAVMDFGGTLLIFEVRGLKTGKYRGEAVGNVLHFEAGVVAGEKLYPAGKDAPEPLPEIELEPGPPRGDIFRNFIDAVRSRREADLCAGVLEGHYSSALCHLANISYRLGEDVPFNPRTKALGDDKTAYETLERMEEHLAKENEIKLDGMTCRLGRRLTIDAAAETIAGDPQAAKLLTREYRAPFVLPERWA
jgi:predicted dehydrogenase